MLQVKHLLLCFILILFASVGSTHSDAISVSKRVLFISSYTESYAAVPLQIQGIQEVLSPEGINLDIEYMDTKRFNTEENIERFHDLMKYKLDHVDEYDALIVGDDSALQFAIDYQKDLFSGMPIVYLGINDINRAVTAGENPCITGVIEETSLEDNIELALKFNPNATRIVAIVDNSKTGIGDKEQFFANEPFFPNLKFETILSSNYTFEELADMIEEIGDDTILLYLSMYSDINGTYITVPEASEFFMKHAKVPVYRASVGGVGYGILGGKMVSFEESGKIAAGMVLKVFQGTPIKDIDVITKSPNYYVLDYEILEKYNIDMDLIPPGTTLINKKENFYEQNKLLVRIVSLIITILSIFTIILVLDNIKRRAIEKALKESHDQLSLTNEILALKEEELRNQNAKLQENADKIKSLYEKYELSINTTNCAVWEMDVSSGLIYFSENIHSIIGESIGEYETIESFSSKYLEESVSQQLYEEFFRYIRREKSEISIHIPVNTNDNTKWILVRGKDAESSSGKTNKLHGLLLDITKSKEQEIYIEHLAHHDYLTDLPNRVSFMDKLKDELELRKPLAIIMLDIDNFKAVNDTLGHVYGDLLLTEIAQRLTTLQNDKIFLSRFGGDEFLILLTEGTDQKDLKKFVIKLQALFKKPFPIGQREHFVEFSMGITRFPSDSMNLHQLIMNADTAMYQVKHSGKNSYEFYNEKMQESLKEKSGIEIILRKALQDDGFYLVYQPQVNVLSGEIEGFEALLRLKNHKIPPNKFINIAEESDLILDIGRKVTTIAIAQIAQWRENKYPPKSISINFSSKQIRDLNYINFLQDTLETYKVDPKYLEIEITESILMDETNYTIEFLYKLKELGVSIALDDFGTGYSSIHYLTYIPVDHVKLDKSLCDKFLELENIKVMHSIISLAHSLNLKITAEGIEEQKQYERLKNSGCDYIQGYYFSKPLEVEKADEIYNKNLLDEMIF